MPEKPRILLIDDDSSVYGVLNELVADDRIRIEWSACGRAGLRAFREETFDLVLLDHQLPDMLGTDALEELRKQNGQIPIVMLTGYATVDVAVDAMKRGATDFFTKPLTDPAAFIRFLNRALPLEEPLPLPVSVPETAIPATGREPFSDRADEAPFSWGLSGSIPAPDAFPVPGAFSIPETALPAGEAFSVPVVARTMQADARAIEVEESLAMSDRLNPSTPLSRREGEIAAELLSGRSNKEIAAALHISERTVKNHLTHIYAKFGVDSRSQLFHFVLARKG